VIKTTDTTVVVHPRRSPVGAFGNFEIVSRVDRVNVRRDRRTT
jgi:hypothetical protein